MRFLLTVWLVFAAVVANAADIKISVSDSTAKILERGLAEENARRAGAKETQLESLDAYAALLFDVTTKNVQNQQNLVDRARFSAKCKTINQTIIEDKTEDLCVSLGFARGCLGCQ